MVSLLLLGRRDELITLLVRVAMRVRGLRNDIYALGYWKRAYKGAVLL